VRRSQGTRAQMDMVQGRASRALCLAGSPMGWPSYWKQASKKGYALNRCSRMVTRHEAVSAQTARPQTGPTPSEGRGVKKINRSHTHTHTDREQHPRHTHTHTRQEQHPKPPNEHPPQTLKNARRWRADGVKEGRGVKTDGEKGTGNGKQASKKAAR